MTLAYDIFRASLYPDGLRLDHLDRLRGVVARLESLLAERDQWLRECPDPALRELEAMALEALAGSLVDAVGRIVG